MDYDSCARLVSRLVQSQLCKEARPEPSSSFLPEVGWGGKEYQETGEPAGQGPGALKGGGGVERAWADKEGTKRAPAHLAARSPRPPSQIQSVAEAVIGGSAPSPTPLTSQASGKGEPC